MNRYDNRKFRLGLALARAYVEMYGGRISAANSPQGGAVFTVLLPLARESSESPTV